MVKKLETMLIGLCLGYILGLVVDRAFLAPKRLEVCRESLVKAVKRGFAVEAQLNLCQQRKQEH